jgi:hypothetical protein
MTLGRVNASGPFQIFPRFAELGHRAYVLSKG